MDEFESLKEGAWGSRPFWQVQPFGGSWHFFGSLGILLGLRGSRLRCSLFLDLSLLGGHFGLLAFLRLSAFSTAAFLFSNGLFGDFLGKLVLLRSGLLSHLGLQPSSPREP